MGISPVMRQGLQSLRPMVARLEGGCDMEGSNTMALAAAITPGYSPEMKSLWTMLVNFYQFFYISVLICNSSRDWEPRVGAWQLY